MSERPVAAERRDDGAPADIDPSRLDVEGLKILNRLHRFGHEAHFVGGCVRDLLLDRRPKDFDIATSAHPGEVRSLFRNCRLIGRRFRLAHVFFRGGKIIEVSTFRANPLESEVAEDLPEDLLITRDNVFGTAEQDARRRDFTVNGLAYDIRRGRVIDYCEGRRDLEARVIRTIGDPEVRLREDPVRILRAVRFAARLDFQIEPQTWAAMRSATADLTRCAPARLLEEVFRLLRSGASRPAFELLHELGGLALLLPPIAEHLRRTGASGTAEFFARLDALDERGRAAPVDDSIIIATVLSPLARDALRDDLNRLASDVLERLLEEMVQTARLPRRIAERARNLLWAQSVLLGERRRKGSPASFRAHPIFPEAMALLELGVQATGEGSEKLEAWKSGRPVEPPAAPQGTGRRRRRRRRRGGPRSNGELSGPPPAVGS